MTFPGSICREIHVRILHRPYHEAPPGKHQAVTLCYSAGWLEEILKLEPTTGCMKSVLRQSQQASNLETLASQILLTSAL